MFRRTLSVFLMVAILVSLMPSALAVTAGDALFGNAVVTTPAPTQDEAEEATDEEDIYSGYTATASDYITLQLGDQDVAGGVAYIVYLQNRLVQLNYLNGSADGVFGAATEKAVKEFQKNNGLEATGIADPMTQAKLFSDVSTLATPSPEDITYGNSDVKVVQKQLLIWGFLTGSADGVMGSGTRSAIDSFKKYMAASDPNYGVAPTPTPMPTPDPSSQDMPIVVDELLPVAASESALSGGEIDYYMMEYVNGKKEFPVYRQNVGVGDKGDEPMRVQKRLKQLNYLYSADGEFGANSALALKYFQYKHGLEETGIADEATQRALFSTTALEAEEYVFPYRIGVDISQQKVYIMQWTGKDYSEIVKTMVCSTGLNSSPTPTGTYQSQGRTGGENNGEWYYFKNFNCYAKWAYRIVGDIMFHSVVYSPEKKLRTSTVENLGKKASHGCIRLAVEDAKWIYDNCPAGTTVEIRQ